jgi:hypothetical protein
MPVIVPAVAAAPQQSVLRVQAPAKKTKTQAKAKGAARKPTAESGAADLAAFFRKLGSQPDLLERFSSSPAGREEVLARFDLSEAHKALLAKGRVRDIIAGLAAAQPTPDTNTVIVSCASHDDRLDCGHDECKAFMEAVKTA